MSRHRIPSNDPKHDIYVGWDNPLETFYAQVFDKTQDEEHEVVLWVGSEPKDKVLTVDGLQGRLVPYATIPIDVRLKLEDDYQNRTDPTMLQRAMRALFEEQD